MAMETEMNGTNMDDRKERDSVNVLGIERGWTSNFATFGG